MLPQEVLNWIQTQGGGEVINSRLVGGGSINKGTQLTTDTAHSYFLKTNRNTPLDFFECEAEGLRTFNKASGAPRVPQVYLVGTDFLLLEDLRPNGLAPDYWEVLGRQLAKMHGKTQKRFGFKHNNYIGATPQPNERMADGYQFFGEQRLCYLARLVQDKGLLTKKEVMLIEELVMRLPELLPAQPASLLHGDLWSGNVICDHSGQPAIIDPAAHYGWAEADLAMTTLFGDFDVNFYSAYNEVRPLESGWLDRFPIYNLYHLLNHLYMFGRGYYGQVMQVVSRFKKTT